jgi:hypothetical protein
MLENRFYKMPVSTPLKLSMRVPAPQKYPIGKFNENHEITPSLNKRLKRPNYKESHQNNSALKHTDPIKLQSKYLKREL